MNTQFQDTGLVDKEIRATFREQPPDTIIVMHRNFQHLQDLVSPG